ncbi:hypothetical protein HDU67_008694 [Dinochytrium kinnereticum]|nr:hypothetical protein HDU67_008694 [Dinochytrium kinnereticum]
MVLEGAYASGLIVDDPGRTSNGKLRDLLRAAGAGESVWTIDLAYMMRHFGVEDFSSVRVWFTSATNFQCTIATPFPPKNTKPYLKNAN